MYTFVPDCVTLTTTVNATTIMLISMRMRQLASGAPWATHIRWRPLGPTLLLKAKTTGAYPQPRVRHYAQGGNGGGGGFPGFMMKPQHQKGDALKEYVSAHLHDRQLSRFTTELG